LIGSGISWLLKRLESGARLGIAAGRIGRGIRLLRILLGIGIGRLGRIRRLLRIIGRLLGIRPRLAVILLRILIGHSVIGLLGRIGIGRLRGLGRHISLAVSRVGRRGIFRAVHGLLSCRRLGSAPLVPGPGAFFCLFSKESA